MAIDLKSSIGRSVAAFRGYNVTNLGRSDELLNHAVYGQVVAESLSAAGQVYQDVFGSRVDLVERVRARHPTRLDTFAKDICVIMAMEVAQVRLLEEFFGIEYTQVPLAFGYSLGEVTALVCGGTLSMASALEPLLAMAADCAELARDVSMGIVFSRGPELDQGALERLCQEINVECRGLIAVSAILAPNAVLILGQADTISTFRKRMANALGPHVHLRRNSDRWPPLHTKLLWERNISNRAALLMTKMAGGLKAPHPPILSLVTGKQSYNDHNCKELMYRWIDHPQRLWDAVYATMASGSEVVLHVGPEPNLIPATFRRLSDNVKAQLSRRTLNSLGMRAVSSIWRPWLANLLSSRSAVLRAPFIEHVILEDWLLEQEIAESPVKLV